MTDYSLKTTLLQLFDTPIQVVQRFRSDRLTRHAAALSFSSLLALAPMMAIVFSMLSLFASFEQLGSSLEDFIYQFLVPTAGDSLRLYIDQFAGQAGQLTLVGLFFFLLTALLLLFNIEKSFEDIWGVGEPRSLVARLVVYWALLTLGPLLMGASLSISTYLLSLMVYEGATFSGQIQSAGVLALPILFELLAFLLLYLIIPNVRVRVWHAFIGAVVASILFEFSKRIFVLYVINFNSYEVIYGALSTLPFFLVWIYLSWVIALVGAEVVVVLQEKDQAKKPNVADELS